jgi:hypothetical protein
MAKNKEKEKAVSLRKKGMSYSQIKSQINVSKSTLSLWLHKYPLSEERIKEIRDKSPRQVERFRETMRRKREEKQKLAYESVSQDIGKLNNREIFLTGLFLYWGEGTKAKRSEVSVSNTDPAVIKFFIEWMKLLNVEKDKIKIKLHLYSDMNKGKETTFWSKELGINKNNFKNPYIKKSKSSDISYKREFVHGTCNAIYGNQPLSDYVLMGIKRLQDMAGLY